MKQDIRWIQRLSNFAKALKKLKDAVEYIQKNENETDVEDVLDEMMKEGLIQRFEYTHELAWNVMKDYAVYQGNNTIGGSRDATREAFRLQLISNAQVWMDMIGSRNKTSHTYNEDTANEIYSKVKDEYFPEFVAFYQLMIVKRDGALGELF